MRGTVRTVLMVGALLAGCKANNDPEIDVSQENLCEEVAEVACHDMFNCCAEGEIEDILGVDEPRTQGQCREDVQIVCERGLAQRNFSVENGRARFEPTVAETCLNGLLVEDECAVFTSAEPWADDCVGALWVGLVADGGTCFYQYECAGANSFCSNSRVCTAKPGDGQPCLSGMCASGLFCQNGTTCRPLRAVNETCQNDGQCAAGLFCNFNADPEPVCAPLKALGEPCTDSDECVTDFCVPGVCSGTNVACYGDTCGNRCMDDGSPCTVPQQCNPNGTCSVGMNACTIQAQCVAGAGDTCNFPVACMPSTCVGTPACGENFASHDFCEDAISAFPVSLGGNRFDPI